MSIKSHLAAGVFGAGLGLIGGTAIGLKIGNVRKRMAEKRLMKELGGLKKTQAQHIIASYESIINNLIKDLNTIKAGLGDELKEFFDLCLPQAKDNSYQVPMLRSINKGQVGDSGIIENSFRLFDEYYEQKKDNTDQYSASMRVLDNIHFMLYNTIEALSKEPTKENLEALKKIRPVIENLDINVQESELGRKRDVALLNYVPVKNLKRQVVLEKLVPTLKDVTDQAIVKVKQANLQANCEHSINRMQETGRAVGEFFLRTLNQDCANQRQAFTRKQMADQLLRWDVKNYDRDYKITGPVANAVGKHMQNSIKFHVESVEDKQHFFNVRFRRGDFLGGNPQISEEDLKTWNIPKFMQKKLGDKDLDDTQKKELLGKINAIMNNINIAIALEEDLKQKVNLFGSRGIVATGEFEMRRAFITAYYEQAMNDFKALFGEEYYEEVMAAHQSKDNLKDVYIGKRQESLKGQPSKATQAIIGNLSHFKTSITDSIDTVANQRQETTKAHQNIESYIGQDSQYLAMKGFELDSNDFLYNMAFLASQNPALEKSINQRLANIEDGLSNTELQKFQNRRAHYNQCLKVLKYVNNKDSMINISVDGMFSSKVSFHFYSKSQQGFLPFKDSVSKPVYKQTQAIKQLIDKAVNEGYLVAVEKDGFTAHNINVNKLSNVEDILVLREIIFKLQKELEGLHNHISPSQQANLSAAVAHQAQKMYQMYKSLEEVLKLNNIKSFDSSNPGITQLQYREQSLALQLSTVESELEIERDLGKQQQRLHELELQKQKTQTEELLSKVRLDLKKAQQSTTKVQIELNSAKQKNLELGQKVSEQKNIIDGLKEKITKFVKKSTLSTKSIVNGLDEIKNKVTKLNEEIERRLNVVQQLMVNKSNPNMKELNSAIEKLEDVKRQLKSTLSAIKHQVEQILIQAQSNLELIKDVDKETAQELNKLIEGIQQQQKLLADQKNSLDKASHSLQTLKSQIASLEQVIKSKNHEINILQNRLKYRRATDFAEQFERLDVTANKNTSFFSSYRTPKAKFLQKFIAEFIGSAIDNQDIAGLKQKISKSQMANKTRHSGVEKRKAVGQFKKADGFELQRQNLGDRMLAVIGKDAGGIKNNDELYRQLRSPQGFIYRDHCVKLLIPGDRGYDEERYYAIELYKVSKNASQPLQKVGDRIYGTSEKPYLYEQYQKQEAVKSQQSSMM